MKHGQMAPIILMVKTIMRGNIAKQKSYMEATFFI